MKYLWLLLIADLISPASRVHNVDLLELNFVENASHSFCQVIVWERIAGTGQYVVRDWDIIDHHSSHVRVPMESAHGYRCLWVKSKRPVTLRSPIFIETYTTYDRERENQKVLHPDFRLRIPD
jgi:hypothetical protein